MCCPSWPPSDGPLAIGCGLPHFSEPFGSVVSMAMVKLDETCQPRRCERYGAKSMGFFCFSVFCLSFEWTELFYAILRSHSFEMCHCFSEWKPPTSNFGAGVDNSTSLKNIAHSVSIFENLMCQIRNLGIEGCLRMITTQASLIYVTRTVFVGKFSLKRRGKHS